MALFLSDLTPHKQNRRDVMDLRALLGEQEDCKGEFTPLINKIFYRHFKLEFLFRKFHLEKKDLQF